MKLKTLSSTVFMISLLKPGNCRNGFTVLQTRQPPFQIIEITTHCPVCATHLIKRFPHRNTTQVRRVSFRLKYTEY
jgi:hypothetical protein